MADTEPSERDLEKAFWATCGVDTYDKETRYGCGSSYDEMVKQSRDGTYHGDWVRAEDFRSRVEELERELSQYRIPEQEPGLGPSKTDRGAAVRWYKRCQELERELASLRRDYQTSLALEQGLHERSLKAESELAAEREEVALANNRARQAQEDYEGLRRGKERLETALAAERSELQRYREVIERVLDECAGALCIVRAAYGEPDRNARVRDGFVSGQAGCLARIQDLCQTLSATPPAEAPCDLGPECPACKEERGDYWREECADLTRKLAEAEAECERLRYKGCGSYPRAIGEIEALLGITAAVPLSETVDAVRDLTRKLDQAQRENATLGADNERAARELLEAKNCANSVLTRLATAKDLLRRLWCPDLCDPQLNNAIEAVLSGEP